MLDEILEKAKWGSLNINDKNWIKSHINTLKNGDLYKLVHIIGRANCTEYTQFLESLLTYPDYPMVSRIALWSLCIYWSQTSKYLPEVRKFVDGLEWDQDEEVRISAISIVGEHLRAHDDLELLSSLLNIFEDKSERKIIRDGAYIALARSDGKGWKDLPSGTKQLNFETDVDWQLIEKLKLKLR